MKKYTGNTIPYVLLFAYLAIFAVAYSLFERNPPSTGLGDIGTETEERIINPVDGSYHAIILHPFTSIQRFGQPNHRRKHRDHPSFGFRDSILPITYISALLSKNTTPEKNLFSYYKIRIHLLNCILLN